MKTLLLPALESLIQNALRYDAATHAQLKSLGEMTLRLDITDWDQTLYFVLQNDTVCCYSKPQAEPKLTIKGKLLDLMAATSKTKRKLRGVHIEGDVHTAQALFKILQGLDIDWEEALSQCCGDKVAYPIGAFLRGAGRSLKKIRRSLRDSTALYLKDEAELIIDPKEAEDWMTSVETLRDDVERLDIRIKRLENTIAA